MATEIIETDGIDLHELLRNNQIDPSSLTPFQQVLLIADGIRSFIFHI